MPYYRRNLCVLSLTIFLAAASWNQIIPFLPLFLKQMGVGKSLYAWVSIVFALQSISSIAAQPFWGKLGDNYGRKVMVIRAGFCLMGIYFAMSVCNAPWQLALLRFLNGALTGFIPGSVTLIATNTPSEYAPRSVATAQAASAAGLIVGPALGGLLGVLVGYRGAMLVSGFAVLISTLLVWWLVQEPNKPRDVEKTSLAQDFLIALRSPVQLAILAGIFFAWIFSNAINPYLTLYLGEMSTAEWLVGIIYALPAVAFVLSAHMWTRLGERVGFERIVLLGLAGGGFCAAVLALAHSVWVFALLYFVTGIWMASVQPGTAALTCVEVDESFRGRAYGIQQSAGTLGGFVAPLAAGRISSMFGLRSIFLLVGIILLFGAITFKLLIARWRDA
ncbi:MAG: MFS transporter [Armatimonadota bacterium]|nr:MFS transporter [bacterium]